MGVGPSQAEVDVPQQLQVKGQRERRKTGQERKGPSGTLYQREKWARAEMKLEKGMEGLGEGQGESKSRRSALKALKFEKKGGGQDQGCRREGQ